MSEKKDTENEEQEKETFVRTDFASEFALREQLPEFVEFDVELRGDNWTFKVQRVAREKMKHVDHIADKKFRELGTTLREERMELIGRWSTNDTATMTPGQVLGLNARLQQFNEILGEPGCKVLKPHVVNWEHHSTSPMAYSEKNRDLLFECMDDDEKGVFYSAFTGAIRELERKKGLLVTARKNGMPAAA